MPANAQITFSISISQQSCTNDGAASVVISGGTAPYRCYWNGGGISGSGTTMNALPAGCYFLGAYDTLWNYGDTSFVIGVVQIDSIITTPEHCIATDGSASIYFHGGSPSFLYSWDNGVTNTGSGFSDMLTNLVSGIYGVTVTDANGCAVTYANDSLNPYNPNANISNYVQRTSPITTTISTTFCNCNDGSATIIPSNGTPPYSYYWDNIAPVQFTQTATGLEAFTFTIVTVRDSVGCEAYNYAQIDPGPNYIESTALVNYTVCPSASGSILISPSGGTPPYSLLWNTGDTTALISGLAYGNYSCSITDASGCSVVRNKFVDQVSPLSLVVDIDSATCGNADGRVIATVTGGTPPYNYLWSDNSTSTIAFLYSGWQYISVTDANNCPALNEPFYVPQPDSCYSYLTGIVTHDLNGNCVADAGDFGLGYPDVQVNPWVNNDEYFNIDKWGSYYARIRPGNVVVQQDAPASWSLICPANPAVNISASAGQTYINNFYDQPDSLFDDWSISNFCFGDTIVHGIQRHLLIRWRNSGTTVLSGNVELRLDPRMNFLSSSPAPDIYDSLTNIASYSLINERPRWFGDIWINVLVPATVPILFTAYQ
ncbi:MAG: SprB repeat-containing protein [Bacteroidota bacterium]